MATARARLAQSEKLAALGQLAAAIAHEVRNPLAVIRSAAQGLGETLPAADAEAQRALRASSSAEIDRLDERRHVAAGVRAAAAARARGRSPSATLFDARAGARRRRRSQRSASARARRGRGAARGAGRPRPVCQVLARPPRERRGGDAGRRRRRLEARARGRRRRRARRRRQRARRARGAARPHLRAVLHDARRAAPASASPSRARSSRRTAGAIDVDERPGGGACFRIPLPRAEAQGGGVTPRILIVDDEPRMARGGRRGARARRATSARRARRRGGARRARDARRRRRRHRLEDAGHGRPRRCCAAARAAARRCPSSWSPRTARVPSAVAAMREGAFDYVTKPFDNDELRALRRARARPCAASSARTAGSARRWRARYAPDAIVAESAAQPRRCSTLVRRVAPSRATVLIQGESGTGKELVARLLHYWSERVGRPFVAVNCKAFAEGVLESELFGHEKGAFTGRDRGARRLLRARRTAARSSSTRSARSAPTCRRSCCASLQEGEVLRVGGAQPRRGRRARRRGDEPRAARRDRRRPLPRGPLLPPERHSRSQLAPLRERREDVLPLARHFLARHAAEAGRRSRASSPEAEAALLAHPLARQRARAGERDRARRRARARRRRSRPRTCCSSSRARDGRAAVRRRARCRRRLDRAAAARIRSALAAAGGQAGGGGARARHRPHDALPLMRRLG